MAKRKSTAEKAVDVVDDLIEKDPETKEVIEKGRVIEIPPMRIGSALVEVIGTSAIFQNRMSEQSLEDIVKQRQKGGTQAASKQKQQEPLDVMKEAVSKIWFVSVSSKNGNGSGVLSNPAKHYKDIDFSKSEYGLPAAGLRKSIAAAAYMVQGIYPKVIFGAMSILPDDGHLLRLDLKGNTTWLKNRPQIRRGWGKINRAFHVYHQPVFWPWKLVARVKYDLALIDIETILNLMRHAGFKIGVGNNRPEKGGENGQFRLGTVTECEMDQF